MDMMQDKSWFYQGKSSFFLTIDGEAVSDLVQVIELYVFVLVAGLTVFFPIS
jgi:hypothetical protein